jgi:hypothetical protein
VKLNRWEPAAAALAVLNNAEEGEWALARSSADFLDHVFGRTGETTETALRRVAAEPPLATTVEFVRSYLADIVLPMKPYLIEFACDRVPTCLTVGRDFGMYSMMPRGFWRNDIPTNGRPREHDGETVRAAMMRADALARRMVGTTGWALNGGACGPVCPAGVGLDLYAVGLMYKDGQRPSFDQAMQAVDGTRFGTRYSLLNLTRAAMASVYDMTVSTMSRLERALA